MTRWDRSTTCLPAPTLLERLVRIPSVTGDESAAVSWLQSQRDGFRIETDAAGNFIAEAGEQGPIVWFVGHIDTVSGVVPVRVEDGVLWGRGTVDAKGPLVAAYVAAREWIGRRGLRVRVIGCVDEEGHSHGARALQGKEAPAAIIVGEPSGVDGITLGYKGLVRGTASISMPRLHAGHPGTGACEALWQAWARAAADLAFGDGFEDVQGRVVGFTGGYAGIQDEARLDFDIRLPPGLQPDAAVLALEAALGPEVMLCVDEQVPAAVGDGRNPLVAAFRSAIRAEGMTPRPKRKTGTADLNLLMQWYPQVPMVAYGPGDSHLDHGPEERIVLAELEASVRVLGRVFTTLSAAPPAPPPLADE